MWNFFRRKRPQDSEKTAVDPICGMTVEKATALKSERDGQTYYFCSQTCLHTFESQPA
ncbi:MULTISPECIES: YHS domain-containing protein [Nostoc]|uniref:YHS domain-containing protein n=1 Tax=Nostoc paludosum FACHB-159 TaxID=2692908 RepID=A0ABR8KHC6_9NOSO|nr:MULTISPECIES: YHS domain-containing protein [Nostoc]MBD2681902.1 YHS domain-containing protein [Nostoc sp. FACHB-857]MBD2738269.1 YHS domain-containing protein [Nostoc paludosum FACHB-159]